MTVEIPGPLIERLLWLQNELKTQDNKGCDHPAFVIQDGHGHCLGEVCLTRFMALQYVHRPEIWSIKVAVEERSDRPEWVFLRELILGMDLTTVTGPKPAAPARLEVTRGPGGAGRASPPRSEVTRGPDDLLGGQVARSA